MTKEQLLEKYIELARKINKMPSVADCVALLDVRESAIRTAFGNLSNLKELALRSYPELGDMVVPAILGVPDIKNHRERLLETKTKKQNLDLVKSVNTLDFIEKFAENTFKDKVKPVGVKAKSKKKIERVLNLILSDHHYGSDLHNEETGNDTYTVVEESRRLAHVVKETIEYKPQYRAQTKLLVHLNGDMIENKMHDPQDAAPMAEQVCRAIHVLTQAIAQLAEAFPEVEVVCATGNHGRSLTRHPKRATTGKWDSYETIIYYSIKTSLSLYPNLTISIPKTPYCVTNVLGHSMFTTHGDNVINPGNPGKSINMKALEGQINAINSALSDQDEHKVFIVGHVHTASITLLNNGATMITNGALCPGNGFTTSIGIMESNNSQTLFETVKDHAVGDIRLIKVGPKQDKDASLDKIIKPWKSL